MTVEARKQTEPIRSLWGRILFAVKQALPLRRVSDRQKLLKLREETFRKAAEQLAERVYSGDMTVAQWQAAMRGEVKELLTSATIIGSGGNKNLVGFREWGATGQRCRKEYGLLDRYANEIVKRTDEKRLTLDYLKYRSDLYSGAARHPFARAELAQRPEEYFSWKLNVRKYVAESEHCPDCKGRVGHPDFTHVRKAAIKNWPGDLSTQCGCNCNCGWVAD